ncbi:MAG: TraV family lipoprotein [Alphaproteobacteria bacterium]|nr:TraV family lipoprotein [Alphaproteobacteria bacterium]MBP9777278.1 TraV family lipoprotein [Alphaproteobacteria bacterium]
MNIKPMTLLMTVAIANGCTPYSESFDCPPGRGVGCKSLNIVNHMVEEGQLPLENAPFESESLKSEPLETESPKTLSDQGKEEDKKPTSPSSCLIEAMDSRAPLQLVHQRASHAVPRRETHLKVWVAAYEDEEGAYHSPSFIYAALKKDSSPQSVEGKK